MVSRCAHVFSAQTLGTPPITSFRTFMYTTAVELTVTWNPNVRSEGDRSLGGGHELPADVAGSGREAGTGAPLDVVL